MNSNGNKRKTQRGYTILEMLAVVAIMGAMGAFLIMSRGESVKVASSASFVAGLIRDVQLKAVSVTLAEGKLRCGFGFRSISGDRISIYAGAPTCTAVNWPNACPNAGIVDCSTQSKKYEGMAVITETRTMPDINVEIKKTTGVPNPELFYSVFFEPPDPRTYVNGLTGAGVQPSRIILGPVGVSCDTSPSRCKAICVYASGKIETPSGVTCP